MQLFGPAVYALRGTFSDAHFTSESALSGPRVSLAPVRVAMQ